MLLCTYGHAEYTFDEFKRKMTTADLGELLESALVELWRNRLLHGYRYRKLRLAMRWLPGERPDLPR